MSPIQCLLGKSKGEEMSSRGRGIKVNLFTMFQKCAQVVVAANETGLMVFELRIYYRGFYLK